MKILSSTVSTFPRLCAQDDKIICNPIQCEIGIKKSYIYPFEVGGVEVSYTYPFNAGGIEVFYTYLRWIE